MKCPFCQHTGPARTVGTLAICSQCGESFPLLAGAVGAMEEDVPMPGVARPGAPKGPAAANDFQAQVERFKQARHARGMMSVKRAFIILFCAAAASFLLGLAYRLANAPKRLSKDLVEREAVDPYPPLKLPALRFVSKEANFLLAIQRNPLVTLQDLDQPLHTICETLNLPKKFLFQLPEALGTQWENIQELVLAGAFQKLGFPPRVWLILHVREPIDVSALAKRPGSKIRAEETKEIVEFSTDFKLGFFGWQPVEKYFLVSLSADDLLQLPDVAQPDADHLAPAVQALVQQRLTEDMPAWLVLDSASVDRLGLFALLPVWGREWLQYGGVVAGLRIEPKQQLGIWYDLANEEQAGAKRKELIEKYKVQEGTIQIGGGGKTVLFKFDWKAETLRELLSGAVPKPAKP